MTELPSFDVCGERDTCAVWTSSSATPAALTAAITARVSVAFCASAAAAVAARVSTVKLKAARSGTVVMLPFPVTVIVFSVSDAAAAPPCGRRTATSAPATTSATSAAIPARRFTSGRRFAEPAEVRRPRRRDARRRKLDEEDRLRGPRLRLQLEPRLLQRSVPLAQIARCTGRDHVLPHRLAALRARDHVVERQPSRGRPAVDAAPAVAREEGATGDLPLDRPRHPDVLDEPDHMRPGEAAGGTSKRLL